MGVRLWIQSGQKGKRPGRRDPLPFVLDVVDDQPIQFQGAEALQLARHDARQLAGGRGRLGRCHPVKTDSSLPGGEFFDQRGIHGTSLSTRAEKRATNA
jgi:hypothetical protein